MATEAEDTAAPPANPGTAPEAPAPDDRSVPAAAAGAAGAGSAEDPENPEGLDPGPVGALAPGTECEVDTRRPILLNGLEGGFVVTAGAVDLRWRERTSLNALGFRLALMRLETGALIPGLPRLEDTDKGAVGRITLVALPGARVRRIGPDEVFADPARLDSWLERLGALVGVGPPPSDPAAPGEATVDPGELLGIDERCLWVKPQSGAIRFHGLDPLMVTPDDPGLPVTRHGRLVLVGGPALMAAPTRLLAEAGRLARGLERYHRWALGALQTYATERYARESARVVAREHADRTALGGSLVRIGTIFQPAAARPPSAQLVGGAALIEAAQRVGAALGVPVTVPVLAETESFDEAVAAIARASRLRTRRVSLIDDWSRLDAGPILARRSEDDRPVALVPDRPGRYLEIDGRTGRRRRVTRVVAAGLATDGYVFYRRFADAPVRTRDILSLVGGFGRRDLSVLVLTGLVVGLLSLAIPVATGLLLQSVIPLADRTELLTVTLGLAALGGGAAAFQFVRAAASARLQTLTSGTVEAAVWDRLIKLPASFYRGFPAADLAQRAGAVNQMRALLTGATLSALLGVVFSVFNLGLLFVYDPMLALVALGFVVVVAAGLTAISVMAVRLQRRQLAAQSAAMGWVLQLIGGIAKLRAAGAETRAFVRWLDRFGTQTALFVRQRSLQVLAATLSALIPPTTILLLIMTMWVRAEGVSAADFTAFNAAFGQFIAAFMAVIGVLPNLLGLGPLAEQARPIMDARPEADLERPDPGRLEGLIELTDVSFRYMPDGPLVLTDVSISAKPGEFVAIVGPSGSGKSTVMRLLLGFETPEAGSIFIDGHDLAMVDMAAVRRQFGVVLQRRQLMAGTILDNIVGSAPSSRDDAWEALEAAGLADDVREMPMGLYTMVGEGAGTLSGGQRQRLLIARALVRRPKILLLDEATSALDNQSQETIAKSLERTNATRIVIAHRLTTIENADRIYVLDGGRVIEHGPFARLMANNGPFAGLARRQMV